MTVTLNLLTTQGKLDFAIIDIKLSIFFLWYISIADTTSSRMIIIANKSVILLAEMLTLVIS